MVGTDHDEAVAAKIGRTANAVTRKRQELGLPAFSGWLGGGRAWTPAEDAVLGTDTDAKIAPRIDRTPRAVSWRRESLGIEPFVCR